MIKNNKKKYYPIQVWLIEYEILKTKLFTIIQKNNKLKYKNDIYEYKVKYKVKYKS